MRRKKMTPEELPRHREEEQERRNAATRQEEYFRGIQAARLEQKRWQEAYDRRHWKRHPAEGEEQQEKSQFGTEGTQAAQTYEERSKDENYHKCEKYSTLF